MSDKAICPECLVARPRIMFSDGVCHICAGIEINPFSHRAVTTRPVPVKTPEQAKREQEQALRIKAEAERVERERQEAFNAEQEAKRELAKREAARRNLLPFVMYFNESYSPGWVHADICQHLEQFSRDVVAGKSPRLMLLLGPRHGKSELASKTFPAWHLGHNPNHDIIGCSYSAALAIDFSRKARGLIQDPRYSNIFPDTAMDETSQSAERWNTSSGGGYVAAGVQGPITGRGAHCFPAGTAVTMADGSRKDISKISVGDRVLSFDTRTRMYTFNRVIAKQVKHESRFTELRTTSGKYSRPTGTHRYYLPALGQWVESENLSPGDEVVITPDTDTLRLLRTHCRTSGIRYTQKHNSRAYFGDLLTGLQRGTSEKRVWHTLSNLWRNREAWAEVLLSRLYSEPATAFRSSLCYLWHNFCPVKRYGYPLFGQMCEYSALIPYDGREQLELPPRKTAQSVFFQSSTGCKSPRWLEMCGMRSDRPTGSTPHGRGQVQRRFEQPCDGLQIMPLDPPHVEYDTVSSVTITESQSEAVYDIQVEGTQCFFADGILVHNCAIIDDPVKDREAAESETTRQAVKDWYSSTLYTRLAPGGGILIIQTRWHEDDLSGWLLEQMKEAEQEMAETGEWPVDADRWKVVRYPAIATHDEPYRKAGEALHPERYPLDALNRIRRTLIPRDWEALYQQNPVSADGDYFKKGDFRLYDTAPPLDTLRIYAAWDLAIGQKTTNDYTCGIVIGVDRDNDIWLLHRYYGRWGADELIQQFFDCQRVWNPVTQGIEHGQIEMTLEPFIVKEMAEKRQKFNYIKLKTRGNDKMTRARPIQGRMQQGRVHFPRGATWFQELQNEMLAFPSGKHDDQVDALAWIGQMILMLSPQRDKKPPPRRKGWRDRLKAQNRLTNSSGTSHMAA